MAEPQTATPQRDTSALDSALNTQMQSMPGEVRGAMKVRQEAAKLEADVEKDVARKTRETLEPIQTRMGQEIGVAQKQIGDIGEQLSKPFEVPRETVGDMAQLGALVSMIGLMLGSSGKQSAQNVIGAMNGTLTGYKKGRADMIAQAQKEFETNMKRLQSLSQNAQTKLELASKLAATDTEKAKLLLTEFKAEHAGSIAAAKVAANDAFSALTAANQIRQMNQTASQHAERMRMEEAKRKDQMEFQREQKELDRRAKRENILLQQEARAQSGGGAANVRYAYNIAESFGQAAVDLLNVTRMPAGTVLGTFAGMAGQSGEGIVSSLSNTLARKITKDDARMLQQVVSGLEMNMARALGGGYASSSAKHMVDAYKQQIPKEGDSPVNTALFLARVKQELEVLAKTFYKHPGANEGYVNMMNDYVKEMNAAVPFDVPTVLEAARRGRQSISERFGATATEPLRVPPLPATSATGVPAPTGGATGAGGTRQLSTQDQAALDWANANPTDPRSDQIKRRLGVQ